jgi:hypothetical protein
LDTGNGISPSSRIRLLFTQAVYFYETKEKARSLSRINSLLEFSSSYTFPGFLAAAHLIKLGILWDIGRADLITKTLQKAKEEISNLISITAFEKSVFKFFSKLQTGKWDYEAADKFAHELTNLPTELRKKLNYFDFEKWLKQQS